MWLRLLTIFTLPMVALVSSVQAVQGQEVSETALRVDAIVVVDGAFAPPGTTVGIFANGELCVTGTTEARQIPFTSGSVLRASVDTPSGACVEPTSVVARTDSKSSDALPTDGDGNLTGLITIGRPVTVIEGTAEQTGVPQSAPNIQLVTGTGPDQRICASTKLVPPVPTAPESEKPRFSELLFDEEAGCAKFGDKADVYVGDTFAKTIELSPGLVIENLSVVRTITTIDTGTGAGVRPGALPETGAAPVSTDEGTGYGILLIVGGLVLGSASIAMFARNVAAKRNSTG